MATTRKTVVPDDEDGLTEITKMNAHRVDLVGGAAVGFDLLMAKSDDNPSIFTEDDVVALAKRAQEGDDMTSKITAPDDDTLTKDAAPEADTLEKADLEPEALLDTPDVDAEGDPGDPGSAAWEAVDAARAQQAIELTVALKRLVETAAEREGQEALLGDDPTDADNVWNLSMVADQLDCILGVLAPFAVTEQTESEDREAGDDSVILKSGRVLSGVNEGRVQQAHDLLGEVLGTLGAPVDMMKAEDDDTLEKADEPLVLVYTSTGKVLGAVKQDAITTFADTPEDADGDGEITNSEADAPAADAVPADATAATEAAPEQPADPADAGTATIPGTDTVQAPAEDDNEDVKKGQYTVEVAAALKEVMDPLLKQVGEIAGMGELVKSLQERVDNFGRQPDDRTSPRLNGATGAGFVGRAAEPVDQLADLRKAVEDAPNPAMKEQAQAALAYAAIRGRFSS